MYRLPTTLAPALALSLAACAARAPAPERPPEQVEDPAAAGASVPDQAGGDAGAQTPRREGKVARADLNRVLDAGAGTFLSRGEVKARLVNGQFRGWEVVRTPYPELDLQPGDVILSVNGSTLEHPVDLERLWRDLRAANAIAVDVERDGRRFALRFSIVPPE